MKRIQLYFSLNRLFHRKDHHYYIVSDVKKPLQDYIVDQSTISLSLLSDDPSGETVCLRKNSCILFKKFLLINMYTYLSVSMTNMLITHIIIDYDGQRKRGRRLI